MATEDHTSPGTFYEVNGIWYLDRSVFGIRHRRSTGKRTLAEAKAWAETAGNILLFQKSPMEIGEKQIKEILRRARERATLKGVAYDLQMSDVMEMWRRSGGYCEITWVPFSMKRVKNLKRRPFAPSIDRVSPGDGYVAENCRLVCLAANLAMNEFGENVLWELAASMVFTRTKQSTERVRSHGKRHS